MTHYHLKLPETGFVRLPVVLSVIPVSKSTWWAGVKTGRFPRPVKLAKRITAWRAEDIRAYVAAQTTPLALTDGEVRHDG